MDDGSDKNQKPMTPSGGESQTEFMSRCVRHYMDGGREQDQAVAICMRNWRGSAAPEGLTKYDREKNCPQIVGKAERIDGGVKFVLTDETYDRDGEVIKFMAWRNAEGSVPFLWSHQRLDMGAVLGRLQLSGDTKRKAVIATPIYAPTEEGQKAKALVDAGALDAVSVGFEPFGWMEDGAWMGRGTGDEWPWPRKGRIYYDAQILEGSLVVVGSNPNALALAAAQAIDKAAKDADSIEEWLRSAE